MPGAAEHLVDSGPASIAAMLALLLVAVAYLRAAAALSRRVPGLLPPWRRAAFVIGLVAFWLAWSARLSRLTHALLTAHMVQHLLFVLAAAPLVLLGSPLLVLADSPLRGKGVDAPKRAPPWLDRAARYLTHPVVAGSTMVAVTLGWHIPVVFSAAMRSPALHALENFTFFGSGLLFWWPVILPWPVRARWPRWAIPLYLLGFDMPVSVLSAYLAFCGHVVYPAYLGAARPFTISPLDDQVAAAMLMWIAMLVVFLAVAAVIVVRLLEPASTEDAGEAPGVARRPT